MHVGDLIIDFGGVDMTNSNNLIGIRDLVMKSENKALDLYVRRGPDALRLKLTPKKWSGQGLLGYGNTYIDLIVASCSNLTFLKQMSFIAAQVIAYWSHLL